MAPSASCKVIWRPYRTAKAVKGVMENACAPTLELSVPLTADIGTGSNWAKAH